MFLLKNISKVVNIIVCKRYVVKIFLDFLDFFLIFYLVFLVLYFSIFFLKNFLKKEKKSFWFFIGFLFLYFCFWLSIYNYPKDIQKISLPPKIKRTNTYTFLFLEERGLKCCRQTPCLQVRGLNWCEQTSYVEVHQIGKSRAPCFWDINLFRNQTRSPSFIRLRVVSLEDACVSWTL